MNSEQFAELITNLIFEKKGTDVRLIDLSEVSSIADYFVICTADSNTQVKSIADNVEKSLRDEGIKVWHKEGYQALQWVLLDYADVVVHVFYKEARSYYNLEKLWADAPARTLTDPAAAGDNQPN